MSHHVFRLVVVGVGGVGKSCLTIQFIADRFIEEYDPTLEDSYRKQISIDNSECILDIFDTAGQDDFSAIRDQYYRTGDGFLCVYSIILRSSFDEVKIFYNAIKRVKEGGSRIPFVVVGNKTDLEDERKVTKEEGEELAKSVGAQFMEASAKKKTNVEEMFITLVREVMQARKETGPVVEKAEKKKKKKKNCNLV
jgi:GTPase KRas protein